MEIKISKEVRRHSETIFFGLSTRQFLCATLAVATAVAVYFLLKAPMGQETASWACIVAADPMAAANRSEREHFRIPRSVQQSLTIRRIYRDGIWQVGGKFSRTWRFADINYSVASYEGQKNLFTAYYGVLNALPTDAATKITINNRRLNAMDFQNDILMRMKGDGLDPYRREYNAVLTEKAPGSNNLVQDKYITVSVARNNVDEARTFFHRVDADLSKDFGKLDSGAKPLSSNERLRIFHDYFRPGEEPFFRFDLSDATQKGHRLPGLHLPGRNTVHGGSL